MVVGKRFDDFKNGIKLFAKIRSSDIKLEERKKYNESPSMKAL